MFENGAMPYWLDWGPEEADCLAAEIVAEKTSGKMPAAECRAVFTYGMPGSGKSRLIEDLSRKDVSLAVLSIDEIFSAVRILPISFGRRALTAMTTLFPTAPLWRLAVMSWVTR